VTDYFQDRADGCGNALGVDKDRRFSGLSGYKNVLESSVEALGVEDIPLFLSGASAGRHPSGLPRLHGQAGIRKSGSHICVTSHC